MQILTPEEDRSQWNLTRIYNPYSLPELQVWTDEANATEAMGQVSTSIQQHQKLLLIVNCLISQINWHEHLTDIYSAANVSINSDEKMVVIEPEYLQRLVQLLDQTPPRVIGMYTR